MTFDFGMYADGTKPSTETLGREREIAVLTSLLDHTAHGAGSALLLRGEAGIGKTTLLAEAQRLAAHRDMRTLACSGARTEANLAFAGLHQLLRPVLPLAASIPAEQGELLRAALGLDKSVLADLYRVALAALELLAAVAVQTPLLVVADDAHWLDRPSADVLAFVARRIAAEPIAMILSLRDGSGSSLGESGIPVLAVRALDAIASRSLLDRVAPHLRGEIRDRLLADSAGNPLALTELPSTVPTAFPLPDRLPVGDLLRQSFAARLSELPAQAQALLLTAAADSGCSLAELCQAGAAVRGCPVAEPDIQPAIDARLVRLAGDRVSFCHPLIASAIYQSMTVGDRQRIHTALSRIIGDGDDRRVWHLAAAALGPDDSVAAELEALADRAERRGAVTVSIIALERAASLLADKRRQAEMLLRSSELAAELGRGRLALELLPRTDTAQLDQFSFARMLIVREAASPGVAGDAMAVADLVDAARAVQSAGDPDLAVSALWAAASRCWWTSAKSDDRRAVADAADDLELPVTDPRRIAVLTYTVSPERKPELRRDLLQASSGTHDMASLRFVASAAENLGDHALAAQLFAAAVRLARKQGRLGLIARLQALQAWAELWSGELDSVAVLAGETQRLAAELSQPMWHGAAALELALVTALRGDFAQAKEQVWLCLASEEIRDVRLFHAMVLYGLSVAALGVSRYQDAYDYLRRIIDPADDVCHYGARQWVVGDLAEAALGAGRLAETTELLAELASNLREHPTPAVRYAVLYADAILARGDAASVCFRAALAADAGGSRLAQGRLQLAYGSWLRRRRHLPEARAALKEAQGAFVSIGARGFAYRAAREFRLAGGAAKRQNHGSLPELTPQELQIAQLAAKGLSNRQIGEQLFLSHRTVGSHLYHLFPKLGITVRSQLPDVLANSRSPD